MDFIAELKFKTTEEGGRKTPTQNGYRPHIKFEFDDFITSGKQIYLDNNVVFPGDIVRAEISILSTDYFKNKLSNGNKFTFFEGPNVIGTGSILEITNLDLLKK